MLSLIITNTRDTLGAFQTAPKAVWFSLLSLALLETCVAMLLALAGGRVMMSLLLTIAWVAVNSVIAVAVHRLVLVSSDQPLSQLRPATVFMYIVWSIMIGLLVAIPFGLLGTILLSVGGHQMLGVVASTAIAVGAAYVLARLSLILPDRAIGGTTELGELWTWSTGNGWKLAAALYVPLIVVTFATQLPLLPFESFTARVISELLATLVAIFGVGLLSCAYKSLRTRALGAPEVAA